MFSENGKILYIMGNHDANAKRLIAFDLETKQETDLASDPEYDVGGIVVHPTKREIQAVSFYRDKQEWQILDQSIAADFEAIAQVRSGEFNVSSRDLADNTWLVAYVTDDGPVYYYAYNRESKTST